jgi:4-amino-4-deoxy-L-arabinose transferase-like glycosyltransferase
VIAARVNSAIERICGCSSSLFQESPRVDRARWEFPCLLALMLIAAIIRFWGVGSFGLHRPDEDTTALPAVHILEDGAPRFPSGMFYARAIGQSYMIAASVLAFGKTEFALRLPSVLSGILLVGLAYFVGRRFLLPVWNMAFVGVVALLPGFIADSQFARMYAFLCATLAAYMIFIFRWERTNSRNALIAGIVAMLVAIQFQEIAIFASFLVFFPGLAHGDAKKLRAGFIAFIAIFVCFLAISQVTKSFYPHPATDYAVAFEQYGQAPQSSYPAISPIIALGVATVAALVSWGIVQRMVIGRVAIAVGLLVFVGLILQASSYYHLALILLLGGIILARRNGGASWSAVLTLAAYCSVMAAVQVALLHRMGIAPRKIVGVMVGRPSIWPYLRVGDYAPAALALITVALAGALVRLAARERISDLWLFFALCFLLPLFVVGIFGWYIPPRYVEFAVLPMLICAFAPWQRMKVTKVSARPAAALSAVLIGVAIVNPFAVGNAINAGSSFPDHRGAAQYMRTVNLGPGDVVLAEEVLMQTYYLGHVDYWLYNSHVAAEFVERFNGQFVDEYTHTPVIGTGAEFRALIDKPDRGAIYVIGSGEEEDGRLYLLGAEMYALLKSPNFKVVYTSPNGRTQVLKADAPAAVAVPMAPGESTPSGG